MQKLHCSEPELIEYQDHYWDVLASAFSEARMSFYLPICKNRKKEAFILCQLNSGLCQSLYLPLLYLEVSLRNFLDTRLCREDGLNDENWFDTCRTKFTSEHQETLKRASERADQDQRGYSTSTSNYRNIKVIQLLDEKMSRRNFVIVRLNFRFWVELLDPSNQSSACIALRKQVKDTFAAVDPNFDKIHIRLRQLLALRNAVAHYEPIFDWPLSDLYDEILNFVRCISAALSDNRSGQLANLLQKRTEAQFNTHWESAELKPYRERLAKIPDKQRTSSGTLPVS